jgi:hypothetical protein
LITSLGRLLTVAFSLVAKRFVVWITDSLDRMIQPWFWEPSASQAWTSATIPEVEPHV